MTNSTTTKPAQVFDFNSFRRKKQEAEQLAHGRKPLYVSHSEGKISSSLGEKNEDFGDRVSRIRSSLDRINTLMSELKKMSKEDNNKKK